MNTNTQSTKGFQKSVKQQGGAGRCLAPATMTVTIAVRVSYGRRRGFLSQTDTENMSRAEVNSYLDLAKREWGITTYMVPGLDGQD